MFHAFGVESKKSLPNPRSQSFSPMFFLELYNFRTYLGLQFTEFIFLYSARYGLKDFFKYINKSQIVPVPFV